MAYSRREFLKVAAVSTAALAPLPVTPAAALPEPMVSPEQIIGLFEPLPGAKAVKIYAPECGAAPGFLAQLNSGQQLFVASAIKTFVLCEALRQADSPNVVATLEQTQLELNASIWSPGAPVFNPPNLSGVVSERAVMEAMIMNSDNTATDMLLKLVGADNVRSFAVTAGLAQTLIPDSTRAFAAYLFGAENYLTITWDQLQDLLETGQIIHPFLNNVETLASSADDLVSYYARALQGEFFQNSATLTEFRRILTLCDFIYLVPLPLGVSAYAKSGNADFPETENLPGMHVRSLGGGMFFNDQWVYFAFIINWNNPNREDPETVNQFFAAINQALTLLKHALS